MPEQTKLNLTHLDKLYWKKDKITKGDLLHYYETIAPYILPYLKNRPLVLRRYPNGIEKENFFHKDVGAKSPSFVKTIDIKHENKTNSYIMLQDKKSLLYAVNLGAIELHPFHSNIKNLDKPDYIVIDLDPVDLPFKKVVSLANEIHEMLLQAEITHFCKTSGGRGLHIYIPLKGKYEDAQAENFAELLATIIHERFPSTTSLERSPKNRQKKIYIDYLQNKKMQTIVCAYSVRGRPHAPVSTPLLWKEVKESLDPLDFTLHTIPKRLDKMGDVFKGVLGKGIILSNCLKKLDSI